MHRVVPIFVPVDLTRLHAGVHLRGRLVAGRDTLLRASFEEVQILLALSFELAGDVVEFGDDAMAHFPQSGECLAKNSPAASSV